jgi:hypothetical protein
MRGGFGSAGSSRSLRKTMTRGGMTSSAAERDRRAVARTLVTRDPSDEEIRAALADHVCAWCDDSRTFVSVGTHLSKGHGIDLRELRDRLVLPLGQPFASVEHRERCRQRAIDRNAVKNMHLAPPARRHQTGSYNRRVRLGIAASVPPAVRSERSRRGLAKLAPEVRQANARKAAHASAIAMTHEDHVRAGRLGGAVRGRQLREPGVAAAVVAIREANLSPQYEAQRLAALRRGSKTNGDRTRRPHPCPSCGTIIPRSTPLTCGGPCLTAHLSKVHTKDISTWRAES